MRNIGIEYPEKGKTGLYELGHPPAPGPRELLLRTVYSGITNGTERHALLGEHGWKDFPGRHGYQHVCRVEEAGEGVEGFSRGELVFYGRYVGHRGWHLADASDAHRALLVKLPEGPAPEECALLGVAGVAMRGIRRFRVGAGDRVWVAGAGLIGQFAAQAARCCGAEVTVSEVNGERLKRAGRTGAHHLVRADGPDAWKELAARGPYDCIVDACGLPSLFLEVSRHQLLARGGVIGALAVRSETTFDWHLLHGTEGSIEVSCHFSTDDLRVVLQLLLLRQMHIGPLITHRVPVEEASRIYEILRDRPGELLGVVFSWE